MFEWDECLMTRSCNTMQGWKTLLLFADVVVLLAVAKEEEEEADELRTRALKEMEARQ